MAVQASAIRNAIVTTLQNANISGCTFYPTVPTNWELQPAAVAVGEFESERVTFDGARNWVFDLIVRVRGTDKDRGQTVIGQYLTVGGTLDAAFGANPNLGGVVDYAWFENGGRGIGYLDIDGIVVLQGVCRLNVWTP